MSNLEFILVLGFGLLIVEVVYGVQTLGKILERIDDRFEALEQHLNRSKEAAETIVDELRWSTPRSFADQLGGALLDIRKAVDEVDRSISRSN